MEIRLDVMINDFKTIIRFDDNQNIIQILNTSKIDLNNITEINNNNVYLFFCDTNLVHIDKTLDADLFKKIKFDKIIAISVPNNLDVDCLEYVFLKEALQNNVELKHIGEINELEFSKLQEINLNGYKDKVLVILQSFGLNGFKVQNKAKLIDAKAPNLKARHKWSKEVSNIKFTAKLRGGEGCAIWKSKDELVLLSGAKLVKDPQLNKDGSVNFSAQLAEKFRLDYADKIVDNITTEDIIFKSPNQLGIFLFYGGQNTWQELKDSNGKSLDEWSVIK